MTKINLREFYPWYKEDTYVDVPDEVAETLRAGRRAEHAQKHKIAYHKAYYSLDCDDGIEYSACRMEPSPEALLLQQERTEALCQALNTLSEKQGLRVDACIICGMSYRAVARAEGIDKSSVRESVRVGLKHMRNYLKKVL